jgi:hypothetical protein
MYRIIDNRSSGKTGRLILLAKETGAIVACSNPFAMREKAYGYGITGVVFVSYKELLESDDYKGCQVLIDELEEFVKYQLKARLTGYTISNED